MTTTVTEWYAHRPDAAWTCPAPSPDAVAFHRGLDGYAPTALVDLPPLAAELGVGRVLVKDESQRLGLPAFKALGASWALERALRERAVDAARLTVVAATDGNHGRAVARFAIRLGHRARIVLPDGVSDTAAQAIRDEGADVVVAGGSYDHAVATAAGIAEAEHGLLIQDTSWEGYTDIPGWIVEGYTTLFTEVDDELGVRGVGAPDLVVVPVGVGSLLQAALAHYRAEGRSRRTAVLAAEATAAACLAPSLQAGHPVTVDTAVTVMAGLNCGTPSALAWPYIRDGLDAVAAVPDADDLRAAHDLAALGVAAGPCGAASLAAVRLALTGPGSPERRQHLGVDEHSTVVLVSTEGVDANPLPEQS
ncbi:MAG TPA: diaminopropionate ammonia-lyase [Kineosporiaceae bacterium]|jgi:diaminopropionate ammonia-lyase|nr:diaminopropionate ammonia-lyase [Kineosporiaceae bacterium]